jgi:exodeoxyribonuclease V gamma subunit
MPLQISYIERLVDVVAHAVEFLSRDGDLFARPRIVVPTAGAKAWLHDRLARELGTSGAGRGDGIVANVDFSYPGMISALLQPPRDARIPDPWSLDRLTFAVLDVITGPAAAALGIPFDVAREPLLAARRIATLFDDYHVRRPGMILEWERETENPVLAPTANDEQLGGEPVAASLREGDLWQFRTWRAVRRRIDQPSPAARRGIAHQPNHERLLVAGLQSLSLPQLECLEALARECDVEALLVHPSPGLHDRWVTSGQQPLRQDLRHRPLQRNRDPELPPDVDPLLAVWLSGARELQDLLAARAIPAAAPVVRSRADAPDSLLARMQRTVREGGMAQAAEHDSATDRSVVIHRCHSLSRQAEVLHDTLLQAFAEIDDLQPHQIAIVSPCLEKAAPHLEAVFQRTVRGRDAHGADRRITLPLVVADRGIRETNPAADLMAAVLAIPGSRASIDDMFAVAAHPLVREAFAVDDDTVAAWTDFVERTAVRWGLDVDHRIRHGLSLTTDAEIHTWKLGLEQMLLGALLPDAGADTDLGGVVPLADLDPVDLVRITKLVRILDVLRTLDADVPAARPVAGWCDAIEQTLVALCGQECPQLAEPLAHLRRLRQAAAAAPAEHLSVPFDDVRRLLVAWLDETAGRQPLRTGAITATSMVPLRGVPFRVICVVGYDDAAVGGGEADGNDLVSRQQLVGDVDPRRDERRSLLDCLLAAEQRLVITCNGRNVKTNKRIPLVTPLAELVDFAVRHGVTREGIDAASGIEIDHPRHHLSRRNFEAGGVVQAGIWSHDRIAADVLDAIERERRELDRTRREAGAGGVEARSSAVPATPQAARTEPMVTELSLLERMIRDPLGLYLKETLGIDTWRDDEEPTPATLPLAVEKRQARRLTRELLDELVRDPQAAPAWVTAKQLTGLLPIGPHARRQADEIVALAAGLKAGAESKGFDLGRLTSVDLAKVTQIGRHRLVGTVGGVHAAPPGLVVVVTGEAGRDDYGRPLHLAALHLLVSIAAGITLDSATVVSRRDDWSIGTMTKPTQRRPTPDQVESWQVRTVILDPSIASPAAAVGRLDAIADLAHEATKHPRPAFGKVITADAAKREAEFEKAITTDFYGRTSECALFGVSPSFDEVFRQHPERLAFLDAFTTLLEPVYDRKAKVYILR